MRTIKIFAYAFLLLVSGAGVGFAQTGHDLFQQALVKERADGDLRGAIAIYERIAQEFARERALAAKALVQLGQCYEKLGSNEAESAYRRVLREYADQDDPVEQARSRLEALNQTTQATELAGITTRRVWAGPEAEEGAPTPDGRELVHAGGGVLTIRNLVTGDSRHLTAAGAYDPKVSPDGGLIAYGWENEGERGHVRLAGIDGSDVRVLHAEATCSVGPQAWSSDGRHLLVYRACEQTSEDHFTFQLALVSVPDGTGQLLKDFGRAPFYGRRSFSSDDRYVAYDVPVGQDGGSYDIWMVAVDGGSDVPLMQHPANDFLLGWIPGSDDMLFLSDRSGTWDVWTVRVSDAALVGIPRVVRHRMGEVDPAGFTSDGSLFYSNYNRWISMTVAPVDLATGDLAEESAVPIAGSNCQPMWSRDGQYLAYWNEQEGPGGPGAGGDVGYRHLLLVRHLPTGEVRELATHLDVGAQGWSPDGQTSITVRST
jgi:Tol biopolymer transport system component